VETDGVGSTSAILISFHSILETQHMLQEAWVSCSNPFAFDSPFHILFLLISFSCVKAGNMKFPGVFRG
jgi:hypothetical protein